MIEPTAKPQKAGKKNRVIDRLEATEDFQPNVPRLHFNHCMRVITVNGESKGMVRSLGAGMFLWSTPDEDGRTNSEEEAFLRIGFRFYRNRSGQTCLTSLGDGVTKVNQ
jgi:hypothetical protein